MSVAIRAEGLTKRYGSTVALDGLDLEVRAGEVFGYLGPNGAGKSTTIALLLGMVRPTAGSASILGLDVRTDAVALHRRIAYVPSVADLWPGLTAAETLRLLGNLHGDVDTGYRDELAARFELPLDRKVRALSHGNKQKVPLVAAFAANADLLLLDEPTTGLDPLMEQVFRDCVRAARDRGRTVFLSSHILSEVEAVCDRVAMLRAGRLVECGPLDVLRGYAALQVRAVLAGAVPDVTGVAGVHDVRVDGQVLECSVTGSVQPLLTALAGSVVEHLTTREPSLEELFLSRYGDVPAPVTR